MKIKKVQLTNGYKRFHDLTIDLGEEPKRFVALVGPNGCGKSSVLDGLLYHANGYSRVGSLDVKNRNEYHSKGGRLAKHQDIKIDFISGNYEAVYTERVKMGTHKTMFSFRSPHRHNAELNVTTTKAIPDIGDNDRGAKYSAVLDSKMEDNYRGLYKKYNQLLIQKDWRPSQVKEKIIGDLNNSLKKCLDLEIQDIGNIDSSRGTLYFIKSNQPDPFSFNVLSSGEKEVVDILLDLYLRQDAYGSTIFLIDEPELHINTAVQRKLLLEIDRMVGENCQIWIATHSIGFLRALQNDIGDDCQVIHFDPNVPYVSRTHTLIPMDKTLANWKTVFQTALDDLAGLLAPACIIYCEGKAKPGVGGTELGLDAKVFNQVFSEEYSDVLFVSSGGNTELDQRSQIAIMILNKVFSEMEILVLKDRDMASGGEVDQEARNTYLETNPENHRVLNRWEIENYLYDKEVLVKYSSMKSLEFDEAEYNKLVNNIEDDNLKDETGKIKNICGIKTSIAPDQFKLELAKVITSDMSIYKEMSDCIFTP